MGKKHIAALEAFGVPCHQCPGGSVSSYGQVHWVMGVLSGGEQVGYCPAKVAPDLLDHQGLQPPFPWVRIFPGEEVRPPQFICLGTCMALSDRNCVKAHVHSLCVILQSCGEPKPPCLLTYAVAAVLSVLTSTWRPCRFGAKCPRAKWIALISRMLIFSSFQQALQPPLVPSPSHQRCVCRDHLAA